MRDTANDINQCHMTNIIKFNKALRKPSRNLLLRGWLCFVHYYFKGCCYFILRVYSEILVWNSNLQKRKINKLKKLRDYSIHLLFFTKFTSQGLFSNKFSIMLYI